ncbi:MAG: hypothetical protein LBT03_02140 [Holosporales bacterium]|nr:hypothetical protein [Holosporales bacterium]
MEFVVFEAGRMRGREVPVFAVIAIDDDIVSIGRNRSEETGRPWHHAEFVAVEAFYDRHPDRRYLDDASLYVNLEPCNFCAALLERVRIKDIFFGAYDQKCGAIVNNARIFEYSPIKPNIIGGFQEHKCSRIISCFFEKLRCNGK